MIYDVRRFTSWDVDLPSKLPLMTNGSLYGKEKLNLAPARALKRFLSRYANNVLFNKPTNIEFSIKRQRERRKKAQPEAFDSNMFCVNCDIVMNFSNHFVRIISPPASFHPRIYFCEFHIMKNKCYSMQMMSLTCQNIITKALVVVGFFFAALFWERQK